MSHINHVISTFRGKNMRSTRARSAPKREPPLKLKHLSQAPCHSDCCHSLRGVSVPTLLAIMTMDVQEIAEQAIPVEEQDESARTLTVQALKEIKRSRRTVMLGANLPVATPESPL